MQQIYEQIDLNQYALDPTAPIDWFQEPNCDYHNVPNMSRHSAILNTRHTGGWATNQADCQPYAVDLNTDVLFEGSFDPDQRFHEYPHHVLNTSPVETIIAHPYRFAFKNAHLYAKHQPETQLIQFSANRRGNRDSIIHSRLLDGLFATYEAVGLNHAAALIGPEAWISQPWYAIAGGKEFTGGTGHIPMVMFPTGSLQDTLSDAVTDLLERAHKASPTTRKFTQYHFRVEAPVMLDLKHASVKANASYGQYHLVNWEFLSPSCPSSGSPPTPNSAFPSSTTKST